MLVYDFGNYLLLGAARFVPPTRRLVVAFLGGTASPADGAGQPLFRVLAIEAVTLARVAGGQPEMASVPGLPAAVRPLTVALAPQTARVPASA